MVAVGTRVRYSPELFERLRSLGREYKPAMLRRTGTVTAIEDFPGLGSVATVLWDDNQRGVHTIVVNLTPA